MGNVSNFLNKEVRITDKFKIKYWVIGALILAIIILPKLGFSLNPFSSLTGGGRIKQEGMTDRTEIRQEAKIERTAIRQGEQSERTYIRQNSRTDRAYNRQQTRLSMVDKLISAHPLLRRRR